MKKPNPKTLAIELIQKHSIPTRQIDHKGLGAAIRAIRLKEGVTLQEVALELHISMGYLSNLEKGFRNWHGDLAEDALTAIFDMDRIRKERE